MEEDSSLVYPEGEKCKTRIEIETQPIKKKRRFAYYAMTILVSFVVARLVLIGISFYSLNFDKLILNNMKYDSSKHDLFTLEVSLAGAYSPLFIKIKDIECDVFGKDEKGFQRRLFSLDVPDIEIVKYKTLKFKHDIRFMNFDVNDVFDCRKTQTVKLKVRCKLYYRFCLMKFFINWEKEKIVTVRDDNDKIRWPKIHEVEVKNSDDLLTLSLEVDHSKMRLPPFMSIILSETEIKCGRDLPCSIVFSEQRVEGGRFRTPLVMRMEVKKEDYNKIIGTVMDLCNKKDIFLGINTIKTKEGTHPCRFHRSVSLTPEGENTPEKEEESPNPQDTKKPETNQQANKFNSSFLNGFWSILDNFKVEGNEISTCLQMGVQWIPFITRNTRLSLENIVVLSKVKMSDYEVGEGEIHVESDGRNLLLGVKLRVLDLERAVDLILHRKRVSYTLEFGDESKKFSLLKGLTVDYNGKRILFRHKTQEYPLSLSEGGGPSLEMTHTFFSSHEKIFVNSNLKINAHEKETNSQEKERRSKDGSYRSLKTKSPLVQVKNHKVQVDFKHKVSLGSLTIGFHNVQYNLKEGAVGRVSFLLEVSPDFSIFQNHKNMFMLFESNHKIQTQDEKLSFTYRMRERNKDDDKEKEGSKRDNNINNNNKEGSTPHTQTESSPSFTLLYVESKDLFSHTFSLKGSHPLLSSRIRHTFLIPDSLVALNFYSRGEPLKSLTPSLRVRKFTLKGESDTFEVLVDVCLSPPLLKGFVYGRVSFFSSHNILSFLLAQYLNFSLEGGSKEGEGRKIVPKEASFFLQLDGTDPQAIDNEIHNVYSGQVRLTLPKEVTTSFSVSLPSLNLFFTGNNLKKKEETFLKFRREGEKEGEGESKSYSFVVDFRINLEQLKAKGQCLTYEIYKESKKEGDNLSPSSLSLSSTITIPDDFLLSFFRSFFMKMFEMPLEDTVPQKTHLFVEYDTVQREGNTLMTNALLFLHSKAIGDFLTETLPLIFLKCSLKTLPKYFRIVIKSKRVDLLFMQLSPSQRVKASYAQEIESDTLFYMGCPPNIKVDEDKEDTCYSYPSSFPSTLPISTLPDNIKFSNSKLVFKGLVSLEHTLPKDFVFSKLLFDSPFPFFLSSIFKEPSVDPLLVFSRASFLDFAVGLPFSLDFLSKDNLYYELFVGDSLLIKERVLPDQGEDSFLHVSLQKINLTPLYDLLFSVAEKSLRKRIRIVFYQGEKTLLDLPFFLDETVLDSFDFTLERLMTLISYKIG